LAILAFLNLAIFSQAPYPAAQSPTMVLPDVCWLNQHENRLLAIDHEYLVLYKLVNERRGRAGSLVEASLAGSAQLASTSKHEYVNLSPLWTSILYLSGFISRTL